MSRKFIILLVTPILGILLLYLSYFLEINKTLIKEVKYQSSQTYPTHAYIEKLRVLDKNMEAAPFFWKGELYFLTTRRTAKVDYNSFLSVVKVDTNEEILSFGEGYGLASVLVHKDTLIVIATKNWFDNGKSSLNIFSLTDIKTPPLKPRTIYSASPDEKFFNTSITYNEKNNQFTIAYEFSRTSDTYRNFTVGFLNSSNLYEWKKVGSEYLQDKYTACPTIRYINDHYVMWYLETAGERGLSFQTKIAISNDLVSWKSSPTIFLSPDAEDDINASDFDFAEDDLKGAYIVYANGDQRTYTQTKIGYIKNFRHFVSSFFKDQRPGQKLAFSSFFFRLIRKNIILKDENMSFLEYLRQKIGDQPS